MRKLTITKLNTAAITKVANDNKEKSKAAPLTFTDAIKAKGLCEYKDREFIKALTAYSDCIGDSNDGIERNLDFIAKEPCTAAQLNAFAELIGGYNYFGPKAMLKVFEALSGGRKPTSDTIEFMFDPAYQDKLYEFYLAREGSVCIYVKIKDTNLWASQISELEKVCDEVHFCNVHGTTMLRLWWD